MESKSSDLSASETTANSWFSANFDGVARKVSFIDTEDSVVRSQKIRIYPSSSTIDVFNRYLGLSRYWYNQTIAHLRTRGAEANTFKMLKVIQALEHQEWAFDCPSAIIRSSISDATEAVKLAKKKAWSGNGFSQAGFRSKKMTKQGFGFPPKSIKGEYCFKKKTQRILFNARGEVKPDLYGTRISKDNGRWFLTLPQKRRVKRPENQRLPFVAIDPGVRTFASLFSPEVSGHIGKADFGRIQRLCYHLDVLMSRMSKAKAKQKRSMRKAAQRLRWKIKDLIRELHNKAAHLLVTRFDVIFLPSFETSQMVSKLHSKVARAMLTWSHHRFKTLLIAKAEEYSATVVDVCEAYTSTTCSYCGELHNIGSKKKMTCSCGADLDRDLNGARGIALRAFSRFVR